MSKTNQPYTRLGTMTSAEFETLNRETAKQVFLLLETMAAGSWPKDKPSERNRVLFESHKHLITEWPFLWVHPKEKMLDYPAGLYRYQSLPHSYAPIRENEEPTRFMIYRVVWEKVCESLGEEAEAAIGLIKAYVDLSQALGAFERDKHLLEIVGLPVELPDMQIFRSSP